jgi:hypothetical protein
LTLKTIQCVMKFDIKKRVGFDFLLVYGAIHMVILKENNYIVLRNRERTARRRVYGFITCFAVRSAIRPRNLKTDILMTVYRIINGYRESVF